MGKIADIKSLLSEQCIVAASQMAAAEPSQAGSVERLLSALADFPAWWDPNSPALSPYQIRQIRKLAETSLSKLKSKLRVGDYVVIQMIGRGGMGKVYKAVNAAAGAVGRPDFVALKWIKFDTQDQRQRLRREFEVMNRLKGNPSVVRAVELFSAGDADILVMEFQNRGTLAEHAVTGREEWRRVSPVGGDPARRARGGPQARLRSPGHQAFERDDPSHGGQGYRPADRLGTGQMFDRRQPRGNDSSQHYSGDLALHAPGTVAGQSARRPGQRHLFSWGYGLLRPRRPQSVRPSRWSRR